MSVTHRWVVALALLTVPFRLLLALRPLSPDEAGFVLVARQWAPGSSVYGDHWVDRPPLLLLLVEAGSWGTPEVTLRVVGAVAVVVSVLLAAAVGRLVAPTSGSAPVVAGAVAAVLLVSPVVGADEVNGELLAMPFVLGAVAAALRALGGRALGGRASWWAGAGALATCGAMVKQSQLDGFVAVAVCLLALRTGRLRSLGAAALGALAAAAALVGLAAARGTSPVALADALLVFRVEAGAVIARSAPASYDDRAVALLLAAVLSGAVVLAVCAVVPGPGLGVPLRLLAPALLAWEAAAIVAGGSWWLHYLLGLLPGLVVAAALAVAGGRRVGAGLAAAGLALATTTAAVTTVTAAVRVEREGWTGAGEGEVAAYLSERARPGDTGTVVVGSADVLQRAGLDSPYEHLWSLPVRVRDPELRDLAEVLDGPDRPTWLVVPGGDLATWGVDPSAAERVVARRYTPAATIGDWRVHRAR